MGVLRVRGLRPAAEELRAFLKRQTGVELEIADDPSPLPEKAAGTAVFFRRAHTLRQAFFAAPRAFSRYVL